MLREESVSQEKATRVTSFDVAERAGVNQSTVSRALNGDPSISAPTRHRIEQAAADLGYHIDDRAARLRTGKTGTIAVIVITRPGRSPTDVNPFHYALLGNVCASASAKGYRSLVSFQSEAEHFDSGFVQRRQADAIVLLGTATNTAAWDFHRPLLGRPETSCWGAPFENARRIKADNRDGGRRAAERLLQGGYRNLSFIGDLDDRQSQFRERYEGFRDALSAHGIAAPPTVFEDAETRVEQGRRSVRRLLADSQEIDGLFCCCDAMALGALGALENAGIEVPGDIGVIGFDGLGSGAHSSPPLTTIEPDFTSAGAMLVDLALGAIEPAAAKGVPVHLVERSSVRR
ncbi:LacI family DNA-binding transcriptional regulator [Erythrobacter westpacificensis]|uniref:LacI family DNA-binding transcriptional regulator n=1 Tax=Erythrobacter westpacificensis TaxID=1055231 RepID=A0ABP9KP02_9SPHN